MVCRTGGLYEFVMLHITQFLPDAPTVAKPLLIAHGLFGSARNWGVTARRLAAERPVITVDMRNHGASPWDSDHSYAAMAGDLAEVITHLGGPMDVLGHSMGGKAAMLLALTRPELVRRLIVGDIAPVAYDHDNLGHIAAMQALDLTHLTTRAEADRRLATDVPDAGLRAFFLQSLDLRAHPPHWRLNLSVLHEAMPQIVGWPVVHSLFEKPTLFLTGATSHYVQPEYRPDMLRLFPKGRFAKLPDTGHWLHADNPRAFETAVTVFLDMPDRT